MATIRKGYQGAWAGYNLDPFTFSLTVPAGTELLIVDAAGNNNSGSSTSNVTWSLGGGEALTQIFARSGHHWGTYYRKNPTAGAGTLTWNISTAANWMQITALYLANVEPTTPIGNTSRNSTSGTSTAVSASLPDDVYGIGNTGNGTGTPSVSGGDLTQWFSEQYRTGGYKVAGSGTVTCSFSGTSFAIAIEVNSLAGGNRVFMIPSMIQDFYEQLKRGLIPRDQLLPKYRELVTI